MSDDQAQPALPAPAPITAAAARWAAVIALALLAATFFLISPPPGRTYPGAIPWTDWSLLKRLTDLMSFGGLLASVRGVEIKDLALHLAAAIGLGLLALAWLRGASPQLHAPESRLARYGQLLLLLWAGTSLASATWSAQPALSVGQGLLYAIAVGWAIALAWTLDDAGVRRVLRGLFGISSAGAGLCVWYFYERNPFHRPGFPIGNPSALGAAIVPALLLGVAWLAHALRARELRDRRALVRAGSLVAGIGLLLWCFLLVQSRAAIVALAGGLLVMGLTLAARRTLKWLLPALLLVGLGGAFVVYQIGATGEMGRAGSLRLRWYAWRYATEMWDDRPIGGHGAGAYTWLASPLALRDRPYDPAAFMGDWVEHAHNELFEILAEIGLVGGVTWVGGLIATLFAGIQLVRAATGRQRWTRAALVGAFAALVADSLLGVSLRLPGVPAIFYTLLGCLWAQARLRADEAAIAGLRPAAGRGNPRVLAGIAGLASIVALVAGARNWLGVQDELRADIAFRKGDYPATLVAAQAAEPRLLDPLRRLFAAERAVQARWGLADEAVDACIARHGDADAAARLTEQAFHAAAALDRRAPTLGRVLVVAAECAELLADLQQQANPAEAARWRQAAEEAWREQKERSRYDTEALLALLRYPAPLAEHIAYLRDALRDGFPSPEWQAGLLRVSAIPGFDETLGRFLTAAGPIDPRTDVDSLIASMSPEIYRLAAMWHAARGEFDAAIEAVSRAAELYQPLRPRFQTLYSVALAEKSDYLLLRDPAQARAAAELVQQAIAALPVIQEQKYEALLRPFRSRLVRCLLAAGDEAGALDVLRRMTDDAAQQQAALADAYTQLVARFVRLPRDRRPDARPWLDAALRISPAHTGAWSWRAWLAAEDTADASAARAVLDKAAAAGLSTENLQRIRLSLCREFPALCSDLGVAPAAQPAP